jgi:hypothetical protein
MKGVTMSARVWGCVYECENQMRGVNVQCVICECVLYGGVSV